jgi:gluconolactonase
VVKQVIAVAFVAACGSSSGTQIDAPICIDCDDMRNVDAYVPVDPLVGVGTVELVQGGYQFTEGPQWRDTPGDLLFSDVQGNTIYRYTPGGGAPVVHRMPSSNSNGLAIDGNGALLAAEHGSRSVTRDATAIASMFAGKKLNSPNDVVVSEYGIVYFTDPPYGISMPQQELSFNGVFSVKTDGTLTAEYKGPTSSRPNGIGLSPDGSTVYVADTADGKLYAYSVMADGSLIGRRELATTSGNPDGLAIDSAGNILVATATGIEAFSATGSRWGVISVPQQPANCAFGDSDHKTLYITARTAVYKVRLSVEGLPAR